jgi:hypothetical protein
MKVLDLNDLSPADDELLLSFKGAHDPRAALDRELEPFLRALETYAAGWVPEVVKGKRYRKYSRASVLRSLDERRDESGTGIGLYRTKPPALAGSLWLGPGTWFDAFMLLKPLSFFAAEDRCRDVVDVFRAWAAHYAVTHAHAMSEAESDLSNAPKYGRDQETWLRNGFDKVYDLPWLTILEPKLVESVGRQRVLSTPAHRVEELSNGAVLIVTWPIAAEFAKDEARQAQARAFVHLRPDLDYDTALRTLRERSAKLVPVEPHFHPDVAPFLWRIVDFGSIAKRQTKIAEFNAYRPPEPEEWLPADAAPLSDVTDRLAALEHYAFLAVHMGAIVRSKVPSVFKVTPESLTDLDFFFWHQSFPEFFDRQNIDEMAVPAIGAYLGEVLVRNLGGEWVPRKKLEESQVRVGNRVWLPFVRAWRYLRSNQSLLDYSLTQFYREAERHRG